MMAGAKACNRMDHLKLSDRHTQFTGSCETIRSVILMHPRLRFFCSRIYSLHLSFLTEWWEVHNNNNSGKMIMKASVCIRLFCLYWTAWPESHSLVFADASLHCVLLFMAQGRSCMSPSFGQKSPSGIVRWVMRPHSILASTSLVIRNSWTRAVTLKWRCHWSWSH